MLKNGHRKSGMRRIKYVCTKEKWGTLKTALCDGAKTEFGYEDRRQSGWFSESEKKVKLLFLERNRLYALWLITVI